MGEALREAAETPPVGHDGDRVVAAARGWVGTPYRHQASVKGAGADCLGVVRGVWRELIGPEPEALPPYARTWADDGDATLMLDAARRWLLRAAEGAIAPGDVLLFRVARGDTPRHCGIATGPRTMVHAYDGHAVAETPIPDVWERRLVGRFRFPSLGAHAPDPSLEEGRVAEAKARSGGVGARQS